MFCSPRSRAGLCACLLAGAFVAPSATAASPHGQPAGLATFVDQVLIDSPEIQAADAAVSAAVTRQSAAGLPIYNPELEFESELLRGRDAADQQYMAGFSQTVDWHNKRDAQEQAAAAELGAVQGELVALRQEKTAELIAALADHAAARRVGELARQRRDVLGRFSRLAKRLHSAGDIPLVELELARLSLAESSMELAAAESDRIAAGQAFYTVTGSAIEHAPGLPSEPPVSASAGADAETAVQNHPAVLAARLHSQAAMRQINAADRGRKADPTFGLLGGTDDGEGKLVLGFSIPLQIRNNRRFDVDVASSEAIQAEQQALQVYRAAVARLNAARERYDIVAAAWKDWQALGRRSLDQRLALLERLWRAGELRTTEYLVQLQQTLDTRIAGARLRADLWQAFVEWQSAVGTLSAWVNGEGA